MNILCIDGGGIRGVLAVAILEGLERDLGKPLNTCFDAVAGTSTGSIIAASIAIGKQMSDLLVEYLQHGATIFERRAKLGLFRSIYSDHHLKTFIKDGFEPLGLEEVSLPLMVPAVNVQTGEPYVHRSYATDEDNHKVPLWEAVLASCSAPIFFPPAIVNAGLLAIDGGLWANNPSLVSLTEAMKYFKKSFTEVRILSIGLGNQKIDFDDKGGSAWGLENWMPVRFPSLTFTPKLLDLAMNLSSESITYQCQQLLGESYLRINAPLGKEVSFDEVDQMNWLVELGKQTYQQERDTIVAFVTKSW